MNTPVNISVNTPVIVLITSVNTPVNVSVSTPVSILVNASVMTFVNTCVSTSENIPPIPKDSLSLEELGYGYLYVSLKHLRWRELLH